MRYRIDEFVDTAFVSGDQLEKPQSIEEACKSKCLRNGKLKLIQSICKSLTKNGTWKLVELPNGQK